MLLRSPTAPSLPCLITRRERQTSGQYLKCVAPCHPWHRDISPSMDKSRATLALRNLSAINATCLKGSLRKITPSGLGDVRVAKQGDRFTVSVRTKRSVWGWG